jgi:hypothetical protein
MMIQKIPSQATNSLPPKMFSKIFSFIALGVGVWGLIVDLFFLTSSFSVDKGSLVTEYQHKQKNHLHSSVIFPLTKIVKGFSDE